MNESMDPDAALRLATELVEELLRTSIMLGDLLADLLEDLPDHAFPGEEPGSVLIEMVAGTAVPVAAAAGERSCRDTIGLVAAVRDRVLTDLKEALRIAQEREAPFTEPAGPPGAG